MNSIIMFIFISIINSYIFMFAMTNLLPHPIKKRNKILVLLYLAICQIIFGTILGQIIIIFTISGAILIIALSDNHFIANSLAALLGYLIAVIINYALTVPLNLLNISIAFMNTNNYFSLAFMFIYGIITYTITYFLGLYIRKKIGKYTIIIPRKIQFLLLLEVICCTIIFIYNILQEEQQNYPASTIYFNAFLFGAFFIVTLIIFFFCLKIMQKNHDLLSAQREKESLEEYMRKLEDLYQDMRIFKHDYINILSTMRYYIDNDEPEQLREYFQTKILPTSTKLEGKDAIIGRLSNIKQLELKGILYSKLIAAMNLDLNITLEIQEEILTVPMEMIDLSTVVGALMDNAIEAAQESEQRNLSVALINSPDSVTIIISNSTLDPDISLDRIYEKDVTSKPNHNGLGLYSVSTVLAKYDNVIHSTKHENNIFTQKIELCVR